MRSILTLTLSVLLFATSSFSQDEKKKEETLGWKKTLVGTINLTQNHFNDNWSQGGENSVAWKGIIETKWENNQKKTNWKNSGRLTYGQIKQGDDEIRKSDDELKVESVFTYKVGIALNPYISFNGETQLTKGYLYSEGPNDETIKTPVAAFLSPAYLRESIGLGYRPNEQLFTRIGLSFKETIVKDATIVLDGEEFAIRSRYGNDPDESVRLETGIESTTDFTQKFQDNLLFTSKLELFSSFEHFSEVDVNWDNTLTAKLSKLFSVSVNVRLYYDKDIIDAVQLKQVLGIGVSYTIL